jgi:hypothetical protein
MEIESRATAPVVFAIVIAKTMDQFSFTPPF